MELKQLTYYYGDYLKTCLRDGDNKFIKDFTTRGFKRSYEMWNSYSHDSLEAFFDDFQSEYTEQFLRDNCTRCLNEMHRHGSYIEYDDLFDILLRRLVCDAFIGFKAEDVLREHLIQSKRQIHNEDVISTEEERMLDVKCGIDILIFNDNAVTHFIQVKNASTFQYNGIYITEQRKQFFKKEADANDFIDDGKYRNMNFYIYDKQAFIQNGIFKYYVNPRTNKLHFDINELINKDGTLKVNLRRLRTRELK